ncbi:MULTISPECIES: recombinase family protein [unclassified Clostridium]|uniref:recombinase family protein n=1 Tax=unclassified Clostridium TaxID=2614128 RepID=UPI0025BFF6D3|nr:MULTISPECIES: recombinase family protein [unclassified Clostridium]
MKKVALYGRVSSDEQKERKTIENQVEILESYIDFKEDFEIYDTYLDDGITGTIPLYERPYGSALVEDAKNKLFDIILVWKVDRFGRDTLTGLQAVEVLREYGIEIISVTEPFDLNTPIGRYQFINYLNMAELERNNILDRMYMGASRAAKKGKWMGGIVPYGYIVNDDGYLEIDPKESQIIKKIYSLYIEEKMPSSDIAVYLNNLNIPTSSMSKYNNRHRKNPTEKWRANSIIRILSSTTYKGIHLYGKRATRRKEPILREVPAIIKEEIWEEAQRQRKENTIMCKRNTKRRFFLLKGLIKCKHCGRSFYGISYKNSSSVYSCSGKRGDIVKIFGKCESLNIKAELLEEDIWRDCLDILKNYSKYIDAIENDSKDNNTDIEEDLNKLNKSLNDKKNEKNNILTLFRKSLITEDELGVQLKDIRKEEEKISNLIEAFNNRFNEVKHKDELISSMSNKLKSYAERLIDLSFEDKHDLIRLLVKGIEVETIVENGERLPKTRVVYNLIKLETFTDMDSWQKPA